MAWITPKTDWKPTDTFDLDPDYARIRGNLLHLHRMARQLYLPFELAAMAEYGIADIPTAEFFAAVDGNADALLDNTFRPPRTPRGRGYAAQGRTWDADDLNRIEAATLLLYRQLAAQAAARPTLATAMGGDLFGPYL